MGRFAECERYDGLGLAELIRRRHVSPDKAAHLWFDRLPPVARSR